jgi:hypothetical protein
MFSAVFFSVKQMCQKGENEFGHLQYGGKNFYIVSLIQKKEMRNSINQEEKVWPVYH